MASSLKELIEEWEEEMSDFDPRSRSDMDKESVFKRCISALRDTMLVMDAKEVRKCKEM